MKFIKSIWFAAALFCVSSCSCTHSSKIDKISPNDNYYKNDKYIIGKRIFDDNYFCENAPRLP